MIVVVNIVAAEQLAPFLCWLHEVVGTICKHSACELADVGQCLMRMRRAVSACMNNTLMMMAAATAISSCCSSSRYDLRDGSTNSRWHRVHDVGADRRHTRAYECHTCHS